MVGVGLRLKAWQPLLRSRRMGPLLAVITALAEADELTGLAPSPPDERGEIFAALSGIPPLIYGFWRDRAAGLQAGEPAPSHKE
jgi:hypothetical protein